MEAKIIKEITLEVGDVSSVNVYKTIAAKQGDSDSRFVRAKITNNKAEMAIDNADVYFNVRRADGSTKKYYGDIEDTGTVLLPLTFWTLELPGRAKCDVSFVDDDSRKLTTATFYVQVEPASYTNEDVESEESSDFFLDLIGRLDQAEENISTISDTITGGKVNSSKYSDEAVYFGTCSTAVATSAKAVTVNGDFVLKNGVKVTVKFTNGNSGNYPTLNVNATGAKTISIDGLTEVPAIGFSGSINAGETFTFVYDGTYWQMLDPRLRMSIMAGNTTSNFSNLYIPGVSRPSSTSTRINFKVESFVNHIDTTLGVTTAKNDIESIKSNLTTIESNINELDTNITTIEESFGEANGLATLDGNGTIPLVQLPDAILGQMVHAGELNAATGVATLTSAGKTLLGTTADTITLTNDTSPITGYKANQGNYYITEVIGTFAGISLADGDWLVANDSGWGIIKNTDAVRSVNKKVGDVTIDKNDVGLGNADNTADINKPISWAQQTALNTKVDKVTEASTYAQVYAKATNGTPQMVDLSSDAIGNSLARRTSGGQIVVTDPTAASHAANKKYVDGLVVDKQGTQLTAGGVLQTEFDFDEYMAEKYVKKMSFYLAVGVQGWVKVGTINTGLMNAADTYLAEYVFKKTYPTAQSSPSRTQWMMFNIALRRISGAISVNDSYKRSVLTDGDISIEKTRIDVVGNIATLYVYCDDANTTPTTYFEVWCTRETTRLAPNTVSTVFESDGQKNIETTEPIDYITGYEGGQVWARPRSWIVRTNTAGTYGYYEVGRLQLAINADYNAIILVDHCFFGTSGTSPTGALNIAFRCDSAGAFNSHSVEWFNFRGGPSNNASTYKNLVYTLNAETSEVIFYMNLTFQYNSYNFTILQEASQGNYIDYRMKPSAIFGSSNTTRASVTLPDGAIESTIMPEYQEFIPNNGDLDIYYEDKYIGRIFYAAGGNTIANKPTGINAFSMQILRTADSEKVMILHTRSNGIDGMYTRYYYGGAWGEWKIKPDKELTNTWTGTNTFESGNTNLTIRSTVMDETTTPASANGCYIRYYDKNNMYVGAVGVQHIETGLMRTYLQSQRRINGVTYNASIFSVIDTAGNPYGISPDTYAVTDNSDKILTTRRARTLTGDFALTAAGAKGLVAVETGSGLSGTLKLTKTGIYVFRTGDGQSNLDSGPFVIWRTTTGMTVHAINEITTTDSATDYLDRVEIKQDTTYIVAASRNLVSYQYKQGNAAWTTNTSTTLYYTRYELS